MNGWKGLDTHTLGNVYEWLVGLDASLLFPPHHYSPLGDEVIKSGNLNFYCATLKLNSYLLLPSMLADFCRLLIKSLASV